MRTPQLLVGIFARALLLPLLLACAGSDEPTDESSPERDTVEPTDLPDSQQATDAPASATATALPAAFGSVETDREALVALFNATNGWNWEYNVNWLSDTPLEEWWGISTNDDGRVSYIGLAYRELSGETPPELGSLSNLTGLNLAGNDLSGEIPPELGSLSNLDFLALGGNELSGEIPPELGKLSNLRDTYLYENELSGEIPPELGKLSNLRDTYLGEQRVERGDTA